MSEIQIIFNDADADEGIEAFQSALAGVSGVTLRAPDVPAGGGKWGQLESAEAVALLAVLTQGALVLRPAVMLWLGQGKRVVLKRGDQEVVLENLSANEVERILFSLEQ